MFGIRKHRVLCLDCNVIALSKRAYMEYLHEHDPDYFWEPWESSENYLYVCPKCKREDFLS